MHEPSIEAKDTRAADVKTALLVLHVFENSTELLGYVAKVDKIYNGAIGRVIGTGDFTGRKDETLVLYAPDPKAAIARVLLVGVGKKQDHTVESVRRGVGVA